MNDTERAAIRAVVHQLTYGEAAAILNAPDGPPAQHPAQYLMAVRDLQWCRGQLMALLRDTAPQAQP